MTGLSGVLVHEDVVGARSGDGTPYVRPLSRSSSSLVPPEEAKGVHGIRARGRSLDDILTDVGGADLVKFDIEGVEYEVFSGSQCIRVMAGEMKGRKGELDRFRSVFLP